MLSNIFSYWNGVYILIGYYVICLTIRFLIINSKSERNLNKIGLRISWSGKGTVNMTESDLNRGFLGKCFKFCLVVSCSLLWSLLSWFGIIIDMVYYLWTVHNEGDAPDSIKVYRWKLKTIDMQFDDLLKLLMSTQGKDLSGFDKFKYDYIMLMEQALCRDIDKKTGRILNKQ